MEFSFLKALAASVRNQASSLKRQSKLLHAASNRIFGTAYPLDTCRQAVAVANGYRNWKEVEGLARSAGQDRSQPRWCIEHRDDLHESCLKALVETDSEITRQRATVVLGDTADASIPAVCLWAEQISMRKVPGVIVIDTLEATFQKTPIGVAARKLGLAELFQDFRVIDARQPSIPLALTSSADQWIQALAAGLDRADWDVLQQSKAVVRLDRVMRLISHVEDPSWGDELSCQTLEKAVRFMRSPDTIGAFLDRVDEKERSTSWWYTALRQNYENNAFKFPVGEFGRLCSLIETVNAATSSVGTALLNETRYRPAVVLCDSTKPASMVIATLIGSMFAMATVDPLKHESTRPLLYCSTQAPATLPYLFGAGNESVVVIGESDCHAPVWKLLSTPLFIETSPGEIVVSGKAAQIGGDHAE